MFYAKIQLNQISNEQIRTRQSSTDIGLILRPIFIPILGDLKM